MEDKELKEEYQDKNCNINFALAIIKSGSLKGVIDCEKHGNHSVYDIFKQPDRYFN